MHLHNVTPEEIKKWVMQNAYQMDSPGVLALQEQTSVIRNWEEEPYKSDLKFCLASPVEYASVVSNLGMAILYQEINQDGKHPTTSGVLCERAYFPEKKLLTRLEKKGWPLFSKETFVPLCNFEVLAFSSYYPLQYFNVPRMLEMSTIPAWAKDRDGSNAPIIMGGGISFFNPEPVSEFFDCFFIGEGEEKLLHVLQMAKECRTEQGIDKEKYLYRLAKETDYMYVPSFYDVKYFSGFGVKSRTSKIPEAKPIIRRALANIYDIKPLTRTFVPVCDSADMSISSVEISRGCSASCNFPISVETPVVLNGKKAIFKDVKVGDKIKCGSKQVEVTRIFYRGTTLCCKISAGKLSIISDLTHPFKALDYLSGKFFFAKANDITINHVLVVSSDLIKTDPFIWDQLSPSIKQIAKDRGYSFINPDVIEHVGYHNTMCIEVDTELHEFEAAGFIVHNCEGSARTMPLRERPLDVSLKAFDDVHKETGCFDTTPYGFNLSDHSNIRAMLNYLAKDQDVKIQMSSQRIDMFTEDFASLAYATGNRSVTLAVEGGSERMRRAVNKNLTTQQILEAFEIAMKIGFNKVKIYMIANLPFERSEDIDGTPSQLVSTPYEGATKYHEEDAVYLSFEDGSDTLVSKNFVFYKKLGETTADQLQIGDSVYVDEILKTVKNVERREADLYGPEKNEEDSLVGLMKKLAARRDYWKQQHGGKETVLNWSFCGSANETVLTNKGVMQMNDIRLFEFDTTIWNGSEFVKKKGWYDSKIPVPCKRITFKGGDEIIVSMNHPFRFIDGRPVQAANLKKGDTLDFVSLVPEQKFDYLFYLFGLMRDLCFRGEFSRYSYFQHEIKHGYKYITDALDAVGIDWEVLPEPHCNYSERVRVKGSDLKNLEKFIFKQKRHERKIDLSLIPTSAIASYLRGSFDADGSVHKSCIEIDHSSKTLAIQTLRLLQAIGFQAALTERQKKLRTHSQWSVILKGGVEAIVKFTEVISSNIPEKLRLLKLASVTSPKYPYWCVEKGKIVQTVEDVSERVFGPVELEGDWYLMNGFYSHNTPFTSKNQCIGPDEFVVTNKGMLKASDKRLFDVDTLVWNGSSFVGKKNWTESEEVPSLRLNFIDGDSVIVSANHPVRINNRLVVAFALKEGDTIDFSYNKVPQADFSEKAYLAGLLRDSSIQTSDGKVNKVYFTEEFVDGTNYITSTLDALDISWTKTMIEGAERVTIGFDSEISKIEDLLFKDKRHDREVQKFVLENTKDFASYISGVFDADGSITKSRGTYHVRIDQTSKNLAIQTMRILQFLGIDCSIVCPSRIGCDKYTIRIKGGFKGRKALADILNLKIERKKQLLKESISSAPRTGRHLEGKTIKSIERIYSKVYGPNELVGEWYVSNGFYSHNTPFEFASCMGGLTNRKTLTPAVEAARQLGFKFRVGTAADVSTVAQVMTLGDRRLNNVIYRAYKEGIIQYFGGMGIGKDVLPAFENLLKEEVGHTYDVYGGEKMLHQIFPWDFIDAGMDKTHLKERYLQAKAATNSPFGCFNRCVSCGACMVSQDCLPQVSFIDATKQFQII